MTKHSMSTLAIALMAMMGAANAVSEEECSTTWMCQATDTAPVLDADLSEWDGVAAYTTTLKTIGATKYEAGEAVYKCMYDQEKIYFSLEIPGDFRFNSTNDHHCASIATMFKVGSKATYLNMGGCPEAMGGCEDGIPDTCLDYRVDIGAHWELSGTEVGKAYGVSQSVARATGTGNDPIANLDDEWAVSPYCRKDDDDGAAGNEWMGAWAHTNPTEGEEGTYKFEIARMLTTPSTVSDAQLMAGETYQFGVAFWDPFELEEDGWSVAGHYITGCAQRWIDLELAPKGATVAPAATTATEDATTTTTDTTTADATSDGVATGLHSIAALLAAIGFSLF